MMVESLKLSLDRLDEMTHFQGFLEVHPHLAPYDLYVALSKNDKLVRLVERGTVVTQSVIDRANKLKNKTYIFKTDHTCDQGFNCGGVLRKHWDTIQRRSKLTMTSLDFSKVCKDVISPPLLASDDHGRFLLGFAMGFGAVPELEIFEKTLQLDPTSHWKAVRLATESCAAVILNGSFEFYEIHKTFEQVFQFVFTVLNEKAKTEFDELIEPMNSILGSVRAMDTQRILSETPLWEWDQNPEFVMAKNRLGEWIRKAKHAA